MQAQTIPQHVIDRMENEWRQVRPSNSNEPPRPQQPQPQAVRS
ncbi:hypothetical protein [Pararhizobium sp.]|nr:hypothetical protein [Pararhizobium sp.]MDO9417978.1 hypothetical protein [Pararhizobium sp.]